MNKHQPQNGSNAMKLMAFVLVLEMRVLKLNLPARKGCEAVFHYFHLGPKEASSHDADASKMTE